MKEVTLDKAELRAIVVENRGQHRTLFDEAVDGFRRQATDALESSLKRVAEGKVAEVRVYLPRPVDHTKDYDRVLRMIDMHQGDEITMSQGDFARYVMDDWEWKREFLVSNSSYSPTVAALAEDDA